METRVRCEDDEEKRGHGHGQEKWRKDEEYDRKIRH